jgi:hypothetical protein
MRTTATKRAIRRALFRLGLHTPAKGVVDALAQQEIVRDEELAGSCASSQSTTRTVRWTNSCTGGNGLAAGPPRPVRGRPGGQ